MHVFVSKQTTLYHYVVSKIVASRYSDDFYSGPYRVTFPAGVTTASIRISISDDSYVETTDETFLSVIDDLSLPKHITSGDINRATVTIVSNDGRCVVICVRS